MSQHSCKNCGADHVDDLERALKAPFTPEQIGDLFDQYGLRCEACGRDTVTQQHHPKQELESGCCASKTEPEGIAICAYCWVDEFEDLKAAHAAELKSLADEYELSAELLRKEIADCVRERTQLLNALRSIDTARPNHPKDGGFMTTQKGETMTTNDTEQARRELKAWRELVMQLRETAKLPDSDFTVLVGSKGTPGQQLITAIRQWGEERAALRLEIEYRAQSAGVIPR